MNDTAPPSSISLAQGARFVAALEKAGFNYHHAQLVIDELAIRQRVMDVFVDVKWVPLPDNPYLAGLDRLHSRLFNGLTPLSQEVEQHFRAYANIRPLLEQLTRKQITIIVLHYGLAEGVRWNLNEVADKLGLDRLGVVKALDKAVGFLLGHIEQYYFHTLWEQQAYDELPIEALGLTKQQCKMLHRVRYIDGMALPENSGHFRGTENVQDLLEFSVNDLLAVTSFGEATVDKIRTELTRHGLKLRGD